MSLFTKLRGINAEKFGIGSDQSNVKQFMQKDIKFCVWNVHKENDKGFQYPDCDIGMYSEAEVSMSKQPLECVWTQAFTKAPLAYGTLITSKRAISSHEGIVTEEKEPFVGIRKASTLAVIQWGDIEMSIISIHGLNRTSTSSFAKQLKDIADNWFPLVSKPNDKKLLVFAGDFNTHNTAKSAILQQFARTYGLTGIGAAPYKGFFSTKVLDYAFIRQVNSNVRVMDFKVVQTEMSDHAQMHFTLRSNG